MPGEPQKITLNTLISLPYELMLAFDTEVEAIDAAKKNEQPFFYQFFKTYYVAKGKP